MENKPKTYKEISDRVKAIASEQVILRNEAEELEKKLSSRIAARIKRTKSLIEDSGRGRIKFGLYYTSELMKSGKVLRLDEYDMMLEEYGFKECIENFLENALNTMIEEFDRENK